MTDAMPERTQDPVAADRSTQPSYDSHELFRGARVVVIKHGAESYRLLITRNDRLILQK